MYTADEKRYDTMRYNRCGRSGLKLPEIGRASCRERV